MTDVKDWRGKIIEVGALIVYPTASSSNVTMNEAIVAEIKFVPKLQYTWGPIDPLTKQRDRTTHTVQDPILYVRKTVEHHYRRNEKQDQTKLQKLTRVDRVTVVRPANKSKCNHLGCTEVKGHDDPLTLNYWPAHSYERDE